MISKWLAKLTTLTGWRRTLVVMIIAQLATAIGFSNIFPFLPLYVESLGVRSQLSVEFMAGMVFTAQAATMMIASPIWGALADRYGRKLMVQRAAFGGAILLLLMAFVRSAEELVLLRAVQGMVTGTVSAANALVASTAPRQRMGFAMGALQMALLSGVAIGPLIGGLLADAVGYQGTFILTAVLLGSSGLLVMFGVEEKFVPARSPSGHHFSMVAEWRHILNVPGVSLTYLLHFLSQMGRTMLVPIAPLFIQTLLPTTDRLNTITGLVFALASAAGTASAVYFGRLGDRIGHRRVLRACALAAALFLLPQSLVTEVWQLLVLQALTGAAAGGIIPTISALLAKYTQPGEEGAVYGIDNSVGAGGRAVAPLIGAGVAVWFGLRSAFIASALAFLLMSLLAIWRLPDPPRQTP